MFAGFTNSFDNSECVLNYDVHKYIYIYVYVCNTTTFITSSNRSMNVSFELIPVV